MVEGQEIKELHSQQVTIGCAGQCQMKMWSNEKSLWCTSCQCDRRAKCLGFKQDSNQQSFPVNVTKSQQDNKGWHWYYQKNFTFDSYPHEGHKVTVTINLTRDRLTK